MNMSENELRQIISRNITRLRKRCGLTQAELADKLSYSDKSISKWERGDGLPDIYVLTQMAALFGVTVNDIVSENIKTEPEAAPAGKDMNRHRHILITALSTGLVWFIATLLFFFLKVFMPDTPMLWVVFVYAIPISAIVIIVFANIWWGLIMRALSVSVLVWGLTVCVHLTAAIPADIKNMPLIYAAAGVFQVLVILWYLYLMTQRNKQKNENSEVISDKSAEGNRIDLEGGGDKTNL